MKRRDFIGTVAPYAVTIREPTNRPGVEGEAYMRNHLIVMRKDTLAIVATIERDSLFDRDGNRFSYE